MKHKWKILVSFVRMQWEKKLCTSLLFFFTPQITNACRFYINTLKYIQLTLQLACTKISFFGEIDRYQIRWLYKYDPPNLADNFKAALKHLENATIKLMADMPQYRIKVSNGSFWFWHASENSFQQSQLPRWSIGRRKKILQKTKER